MKRRIRSIFILMTACILGINIFQGYWLYTTYRLQHQQFTRTAMETLLVSLQKRQEMDADKLFAHGQSASGRPRTIYRELGERRPGSNVRIIYERVDSTQKELAQTPTDIRETRDVLRFRQELAPPLNMELVPADTLARRISNRIIVNWTSNSVVNLPEMDSTFNAELQLRGMEATFKLDTIHPVTNSYGNPEFVSQAAAAFPVQLQPVLVNPIHQVYLQASFKKPFPYILKKMGWLLVGSVLLLVLTTGCFLYMLSTILQQKRLSEVKNDFINNMTHELKTPLATVSAAVEGMLSFGALQDTQKAQRYLTISKNELQRLSDLVEKVLNIAVEEKKEFELLPEPLFPSILIKEIVSQYQLKAAKPIHFVMDLPEEEDTVILDKVHLGNTITNLIDNAIKYSYEQVTIHISSRKAHTAWCLSVKDSGIGIPKSYQKAIFDRFFRVPTGDLHQVKGFGLGLSYVKQVVEKHGGYVEVHSEPTQGSEFVLWFPLGN
ncbi:HAMP domain-containing sensor histidine kinase [Rhodocytophaga aerolata]|uniref:histidine kinase n=1 Tax=Rhodocytophaga aerolata TaxID=455078 RepID=A0ABT8R9J1_9BACT|nr:HAMP domain-containing sensor histidine kinase [Rhodocytophaga aerolata]MDO1448639.1 HAMP domain-containing sensor histidine kinase [Rhodocytophaga aerolata]